MAYDTETSNEDAAESPTDEQKEAQQLEFYNAALTAIQARESEFEKGWWKKAEKAEEIYLAEKERAEDTTPYNILYSNTEVLLPALYSATPKPDIRSRYKEQNLALLWRQRRASGGWA